jgi:hypothetical protein
MSPTTNIVSLRLSGAVAHEVRTLAERADEKQSVILRRLIRLGLQSEREHGEREQQLVERRG